jgi:hypothetical protein
MRRRPNWPPHWRREWRERASVPVQAAYGCGVAAPVLLRAIEQAVKEALSLPVHWFETQSRFEHDACASA